MLFMGGGRTVTPDVSGNTPDRLDQPTASDILIPVFAALDGATSVDATAAMARPNRVLLLKRRTRTALVGTIGHGTWLAGQAGTEYQYNPDRDMARIFAFRNLPPARGGAVCRLLRGRID